MQMQLDCTPRARRTDPETSHAAARRAKTFAQSQSGRILLAMQLHGPASARRLEQLIGLTVVQIDRRLCELRDLKLLRFKLDANGKKVKDGDCNVHEVCR